MSAGKSPRQPVRGALSYREGEEKEPNSKLIRAPEIDTCYSFVEAVSPAFDPNRVLLRQVFFIREDKAKCVSVEYYPAKDYQPFVELDGANKAPLILNDNTCGAWPNNCHTCVKRCVTTDITVAKTGISE
jgi:hypothetical protein